MNKIKAARKLRKLIFKNQSLASGLMLTSRQVDIIHRVKNLGETTSADIAEVFGLSVQNASTQLSRLAGVGYLKKRSESHSTGGPVNVYTSGV